MMTRAGVLLATSIAALVWLCNGATDVGDTQRVSRSSAASPASQFPSETGAISQDEALSASRLALEDDDGRDGGPSAGAALAMATTWDDVAPQILSQMGLNRQTRDQLQAELMGGPVEVDLAWLEQRFSAPRVAPGLYDAHVRALELNLKIAVAASEYLDELDFEVNAALNEGRFERSNREIPAPAELEALIFMQSTRVGDWATQLRLERDAHPRLDYLQERVTRMVDARDQELALLVRRG